MALAVACAPAVHPTTMAAIVRQESAGNPYAIGVNRGFAPLARQPREREHAVREARRLIAAGANIDAGLAQINVANWNWLGLTAESVFDPCTNLAAAQRVLVACYERASSRAGSSQQALYATLSCYNTGSLERGFRNGYVHKVARHAGVKVPALATGNEAPERPTSTGPPAGPTSPARAPTDAFRTHGQDAFDRATSGRAPATKPITPAETPDAFSSPAAAF
ncbi:lytic transglycosylase domain-containing protein [Verticiella alkaliphila]|uniref:lytic transglycosylase domain-containing protein n=1 Tax=Verticiella alkaliphila TaxID=2779529 RepID=UPI0021121D8E|nr:lytic transglycosylase domain-containing protein [Verticiella sp. GG226]